MGKMLLVSVVFVPALLGMQAAGSPRLRRGIGWLLASAFVFDLLYLALLYWLRNRWL